MRNKRWLIWNALLSAGRTRTGALKPGPALLQTRGRWPDAVATTAVRLTVQPDDVTARADTALLLLQQRDVTACAKRMSSSAAAAVARRQLSAGVTRHRAGRYDESRKFADIALTGDPSASARPVPRRGS